MVQVALPDPVYAEAARVAAACGRSVEEFVVEAVRVHVQEESPLVLTEEQSAAVRRGLADVRAGRVYSLEESKARLAEVRAAWLAANPQ